MLTDAQIHKISVIITWMLFIGGFFFLLLLKRTAPVMLFVLKWTLMILSPLIIIGAIILFIIACVL